MIRIFSLIFLFAIASPLCAGERILTPEPINRFGGVYMKVNEKGNIWTAFSDLDGDIHIRNASKFNVDLVVNEGMMRSPGGIGFDVQGDNIYVVWREKTTGKKLWFRASRDGGRTLSDPVLLDDQNEPIPRIRIRSNAKGDIFILFLGEARVADTRYNLYFTSSHDFGKTFSEVQNLTLGYQNSIYPTLSAEDENVYMFSDSGKNDKRFMIFRKSADGGRTWSEPVEIKQIGGVTVYIEPIRVGKRLHVLWLDIDTLNNEHIVGAAFSDDDGLTWKSTYLEDTRGMDIGLMRLAHDSEGHIYLAFSERKDDQPKEKMKVFMMRSGDNGDTWEKPFMLRHYPFDNTQAINPQVIAADNGVVVAVWVDHRNIRSNLYMQFSKDYGKTWQDKDIPLEEPGRFNTAHYPLTESLGRFGDTYYELAYRLENDLISTGKADLLLIDFTLESGGAK
jgi:hypothetical protein